ncbi:response regulator [Bacillus mangrovi]|uniref:Circadian input-output histidine kinase CikA n=1 Tax=Metabacillus mangrovi TaxID=1491830 RepID=A0A7X2S6X3_9BACI|nr:ATP-binding protein [Metabacillus mangrovi]MTH54784.1 response regulator [Metabacillus mangrovi]
MKIGIRNKILFGYAVIIVCLVASILLISSQISQMQKQRNYIINHDLQVFNLTGQVENALLEMQTSQRGFALTGNADYSAAYKLSKSKLEDDYSELNELISDNRSQQDRLQEIKVSIDNWTDNTSEPLLRLKENGRDGDIEAFYARNPDTADIQSVRDKFNAFRNTELSLTKQRAQSLDSQNQNLRFTMYGLMLLTIVLAGAIGLAISKSIVSTVQEVIRNIRAMTSGGTLSRRLNVRTNDEIKELAMATNSLLDVMEDRSWVQTGINEVNTQNQGLSSMEPLGDTFLKNLASLTGSAMGVFYVKDGDRFVKRAGFAAGKDAAESFLPGEGIAGQAAADQKIVCINSGTDLQLITSSLGNINPKGLLAAPIIYKKNTIALIELFSIHEYEPKHIELLEALSESMGLTINSVLGQMEIKRLLAESQAMTEELQTQSEELQTQSEELQMQSEELQMINEQLESRSEDAEDKSKELEQAKEELEAQAKQLIASSKYKSEFLANMSHELRTPLNSILILSEMLAENTGRKLASEEKEFAEIIHSSGQDLLNLIDEILDLSKVESGKLEVHFSEVNTDGIPEYIERNFSHVASQKGLYLKMEKSPHVPDLVYTDEKRLNQIIKNLLSNAIKFTSEGGITVKLDRSPEDMVTLTVIDTGIGIPKDKHELIFEAFQQGDGATVRKYGGTGLGLSICRELAKLLGGGIALESQEGKGSTFTLTFPVNPDLSELPEEQRVQYEAAAAAEVTAVKEELAANMAEGEMQSFKGKNVLIVDDDHRNIFVLETALKNEGMNVTSAENGRQCLDILAKAQQTPDIILMDIMMPIMDGYETMKAIRQERLMTDVPIIALTAKAMKNDREKCIEAGASDYISKPLKIEQLLSAMRVWLTA